MNSCQKGKVGEREAAHFLANLFGTEAARGQQYRGGPDSPDVIMPTIPVHWEVKRTERLNIQDAVAQAVRDAGDSLPVVLHRRNRTEWLATIRAADLPRMGVVMGGDEELKATRKRYAELNGAVRRLLDAIGSTPDDQAHDGLLTAIAAATKEREAAQGSWEF